MAQPATGLGPLDGALSLTDRVHALLRDAVLDRRLPPGSHLSVPPLARELGVSRSPVRDAMFRLERDGLVRVVPNRGAIVLHPDATDLRELFEMREALEGLAARLAATHFDDAGRRELRSLHARHRKVVRTGDRAAHIRHDLEFHARLRRGSGNARLAAALGQLEDQIELAIHTTAAQPGSVNQALREHAAIVAAVEAADPDAAERAARAHVARVRRTLLRAVATGQRGRPPGSTTGVSGPMHR